MFGDVEFLQQEAEGTDLYFCDLIVAEVDSESQIAIKGFGKLKISGGHESLDVSYCTGNHSFFSTMRCGQIRPGRGGETADSIYVTNPAPGSR
jgi:hypothetical protein